MESTFTQDDINVGPILGPEYRASTRMAEAMLAKFSAEHMKPLVDEFADTFREKLWDDVRDWLLSDTEMNIASEVRHMVEQTIQALLTGEEWAMKRYPFADYSKGEKVRAAVAKHGGDELLMRRIADIEKELRRVREQLEWARR